jgi:hypothetical protein
MFSEKEIREIVSSVAYLDWDIKVLYDGDRAYLQIHGHGPDPKDGMRDAQWSGRKWFISPHMCKNELIRTAYKAIECAVAHEMNENFLYKDVAIMTPHMDYEEIVDIMKDHDCIDSRINGMQGPE